MAGAAFGGFRYRAVLTRWFECRQLPEINNLEFLTINIDSLAEWSKALASGASP